MERRQVLLAVGAALIGGCSAAGSPKRTTEPPNDPGAEDGGSDSTVPCSMEGTGTPEPDVNFVRCDGPTAAVTEVLSEEPADGITEEGDVRVVMTREGPGEPGRVEYMSFGEYVAYDGADLAGPGVAEVTRTRLACDSEIGAAVSVAPDAPNHERACSLSSDAASRASLVAAGPRSVSLTVSYEAFEASTTVPVYVGRDRESIPL